MDINDFISNISEYFNIEKYRFPWELITNLKEIIEEIIPNLDENFEKQNGIAIHKSSFIESGVVMKRPIIVMGNCNIGSHAYFREGVFLDNNVRIGPSSEIKSSIICAETAIAHLNYIGNSIVGQNVNFEAGSIAANHYNERSNKRILVKWNDEIIDIEVEKFGAVVGDNSKIGANGVLSPGTILPKNSIVKRLELIEQVKEK